MTGPRRTDRAAGPSAYQDVRSAGELRDWRRSQDWTQSAAARWYGRTLRQWIRYESGDSPIPETLTRLIAWRERLGDRAGLAE